MALGGQGWRDFAAAVSGEWSGIAVTYDRDGEAQELPYQYVPAAFREWGAVPRDWHTQCSCLADDAGLLAKLKRLYPVVGCKADAVAFEEKKRRSLRSEAAGCEADAVAFEEEERRSLRSEAGNSQEPKTVLRDGSYGSGPRNLEGATTARFEHSLVAEPGRRARIVFGLKRDGAAAPWRLATLEQHVERRTGDYDGGASLEACGYNMTDVTGEAKPGRDDVAGAWAVDSHTAFELAGDGDAFRHAGGAAPERVHVPEEALLLHSGMWAMVSVGSSGSNSSDSQSNGSGGNVSDGVDGSGGSSGDTLVLEAGWLLGGQQCVMARRSFAGDRLSAVTFTAARRD